MLRDYEERGKRIREFRSARRLTQAEAARLADVSEKTWRSWEAGGGMQAANIDKAAKALNVSPEQIVGEAEITNPFSLAAHLDARTEEFRAFCYLMVAEFQKVSEKLDRQYEMLQRIFETLATPQAAAELLEGAELLESLAGRRATTLDESSEEQAAARRRRAG